MAVQQQAGRSPWDFADSIESAVNNAIDMHYKEKQMRIDEERYNDNKMMTMFQQEFKSYNDQFTQMTELLKMTDDPTMINEFLTGPEYRRLHSSMQSLIERQSEYFRSQGLPEEEIQKRTAHMDNAPIIDALKKVNGPKMQFKENYNKYYAPYVYGDDDGLSANDQHIKSIAKQWLEDNPDSSFFEFFEDPTIQQIFENERDVYSTMNMLRVPKKFRDSYPIEDSHKFWQNMRWIGESQDSVDAYMDALSGADILSEEDVIQYKRDMQQAAFNGDMEGYTKVFENINNHLAGTEFRQKRYDKEMEYLMAYHTLLNDLAESQAASGGIKDNVESEIGKVWTRIQALEGEQGDDISTMFGLYGNNYNPIDNKGNKKKIKKGNNQPLTQAQMTQAANNQLGPNFAPNLTNLNADSSVPVIRDAIQAMIDKQSIFGAPGNKPKFTDKQAHMLSKRKRVNISDSGGNKWYAQLDADNFQTQLHLWGPEGARRWFFDVQDKQWKDSSMITSMDNLSEMGVSGIVADDILSGRFPTGGGRFTPEGLKYKVGFDENGYIQLNAVNEKGEFTDRLGNVVNEGQGYKYSARKLRVGSNDSPANVKKANERLMDSMMEDTNNVRLHNQLGEYYDEEGVQIMYRGATDNNPDKNTATSTSVVKKDFGPVIVND